MWHFPNDVVLGEDKDDYHPHSMLLTGPDMGGILLKGAYKIQLLNSLAEDLRKHLLPAYNTPAGLSYSCVNLKVLSHLIVGFLICYPSFRMGTFMRKFCIGLQMWIYQ